MRNIWTICRKELKSYLASPIAYILIAVWAVIFGYFFTIGVYYFAQESMDMQRGGMQAMSVNERVIGPLLANLSVVDNNSSSSVGGGGTPLQPIAPPLAPAPPGD